MMFNSFMAQAQTIRPSKWIKMVSSGFFVSISHNKNPFILDFRPFLFNFHCHDSVASICFIFGGVKCWSTCWFGRSCEAYWVDCGRLLLSLCRFTGKQRRKRMAFFFKGSRVEDIGCCVFLVLRIFYCVFLQWLHQHVVFFTSLTWWSMITRLHHCLNMNDGFTKLEWCFTWVPPIAHSHSQGFLIAIS